MYAVVATGGKQYKVSKGDFLRIEKINKNIGEEVVFDNILLLKTENSLLSRPEELKGKKVKAKVVQQAKAKKVIVGKYKKRKNYRRRIGHRQPYTAVTISEIEV